MCNILRTYTQPIYFIFVLKKSSFFHIFSWIQNDEANCQFHRHLAPTLIKIRRREFLPDSAHFLLYVCRKICLKTQFFNFINPPLPSLPPWPKLDDENFSTIFARFNTFFHVCLLEKMFENGIFQSPSPDCEQNWMTGIFSLFSFQNATLPLCLFS